MPVKIIMQARWLFDVISELSSTSPTRLDITAFPTAPYLSLSAVGHLGSATVEFAKGRDLLETFTVAEKWTQSYKFEMIKAASEAMRLASKVSFLSIGAMRGSTDVRIYRSVSVVMSRVF